MVDIVSELKNVGGFDPVAELCSEAADEIERLREAVRYYANKTQEEWINATGADDGVIARAALGKDKR